MKYYEKMKKAMTYKECIERFLEGFSGDVREEDIEVNVSLNGDLHLEKIGGSLHNEVYVLNAINGMYYETEILGLMDNIEKEMENNNLQDVANLIESINCILREKLDDNTSVVSVLDFGVNLLKEVELNDLKMIADEEIEDYTYYHKSYSNDGKTMYIEKLTRGLINEVYNNFVYKMKNGYGSFPVYYMF